MRSLFIIIISFVSFSFYAQQNTISIAEPVEPSDKTYKDYKSRLDSIQSKFGQNDIVYGENDSRISVASADKLNVVYRGLPNPISISVPDAKIFEATAPGLMKLSEGKYNLIPGSGLESKIIIYIILNDGSKRKEVQKFRIKNLPYLAGAINGLTCNQSVILMSKKELRKAKLSIGFPKDFLYELKFNLVSFAVKIKEEYIYLSGNNLSKETLDLIDRLPLNSIFEITDFKSDIQCNSCSGLHIKPLKIMLVDDKTYGEEN